MRTLVVCVLAFGPFALAASDWPRFRGPNGSGVSEARGLPYSMTAHRDRPWKGIDGKTTYTGKQLVGLDSVPHIATYFKNRNIDLGLFQPNDPRVIDLDGRQGKFRPKLMERGLEEFLVYHPNAATDNKASRVDEAKTARMRIDLKNAPGPFQVEWFRAYDGIAQDAEKVEGGAAREFIAPWKGQDVVLRLLAKP